MTYRSSFTGGGGGNSEAGVRLGASSGPGAESQNGARRAGTSAEPGSEPSSSSQRHTEQPAQLHSPHPSAMGSSPTSSLVLSVVHETHATQNPSVRREQPHRGHNSSGSSGPQREHRPVASSDQPHR